MLFTEEERGLHREGQPIEPLVLLFRHGPLSYSDHRVRVGPHGAIMTTGQRYLGDTGKRGRGSRRETGGEMSEIQKYA